MSELEDLIQKFNCGVRKMCDDDLAKRLIMPGDTTIINRVTCDLKSYKEVVRSELWRRKNQQEIIAAKAQTNAAEAQARASRNLVLATWALVIVTIIGWLFAKIITK